MEGRRRGSGPRDGEAWAIDAKSSGGRRPKMRLRSFQSLEPTDGWTTGKEAGRIQLRTADRGPGCTKGICDVVVDPQEAEVEEP